MFYMAPFFCIMTSDCETIIGGLMSNRLTTDYK